MDITPGQQLSPEEELKRQLGLMGAPPITQPPVTGGIAASAPAYKPAPGPIATPSSVTPIVPQQRQTDTAELNRLKNSGAGVEQLQHKHPIIGAIARIGDAALSSLFPTIAQNVPGTELHHAQLVNRAQSRVGNDLAVEQKEAQTANEGATTAHTQAQTEAIPAHTKLEQAQTEALTQPKPKEEEWDVVQGFSGPNGEPILKEKNSGQMKLATSIPGIQKTEKPDTATQEDQKYEDIKVRKQLNDPNKPVSPEEEAWAHAYEKRKTLGPFASAAAQAPERNEQRSDRSYQFHSGQLEKARQPIDAAVQRLGRLQDTLAQQNPQADALVAPELLTVMAGGQGSGLRMNEAEIARIVGGRSEWENLKASLQHWSTNPKDARSITTEQDKQIRALVETVNNKLLAKQHAINQAEDSLVNSDDPIEHRRIVNDARRALDAIDAGPSQQEPPRPANVPSDYIYQENGPKGKGWYKPTTKPTA